MCYYDKLTARARDALAEAGNFDQTEWPVSASINPLSLLAVLWKDKRALPSVVLRNCGFSDSSLAAHAESECVACEALLQNAFQFVVKLSHQYCGTEHLLLELVSGRYESVNTVLAQSAIVAEDVAREVREVLGIGLV